MRAGSNTTMSASHPSARRPLRRIAGTWSCRSLAGSRLHFARASGRLRVPPSRVSTRIDLANVPAVRGWVNASRGSGQASGSGAVPIHVSGMTLVHDLFKLSVENRALLAARLLGASAVRPLLEPYGLRIEHAFYKRSGMPQERLRLADARKAIRDYRAATGDLAGTLDLMLTFVETGTRFTRNFGDIDEPFYNSLSSVLGEIRHILKSEEGRGLYAPYRQRLLDLADLAEPIGWGYGDEVRDTVMALERRWDLCQ